LALALFGPLVLADRVIANSEATRRFLTEVAGSIGRRTEVIYNGFEFDDPTAVSTAHFPHRLVLVGRLSPRKGQDVAIAALSRLREMGHCVELDIVGSAYPGYEWFIESLKSQAVQLGVADQVRFTGFQKNVASAYAAGTIALVPSLLEPFGNVAVEALAAGKPVVASRVGGLPEIIREGETGYLVPPSDSEALAAAVATLLNDPLGRARMGALGAVDVRNRFSLERSEKELPAFLAEAIRAHER
jgi:glycosyltransferase involved in cell wall biosynthesis